MTENPGNQLAPMDHVRNLLLSNRRQLTSTLPSHLKDKGDAWLSGALACVQRNPDLISAVLNAPHTFTNALSEAAQYGLNPGTPEYYLTPRKNKGRMEVLGIVGYQGEIELIYRAGAVSSVIAECVYENDDYTYQRGVHERPIHKFSNFAGPKTRGKLMGVYAYAMMKDGSFSRVIEHGQEHIDAVKATSAGSDSVYSPWKKWEDQMWLKTAVHSLSKWVPTSAEFVREQYRAQEVIKVEPVKDEPDTPRPAPATINDAPGAQYEDLGETRVNTTTGEEFANDPTAESWGLTEPQEQN